MTGVCLAVSSLAPCPCAHHGLQAYYFQVLPMSRMQGVVSFTPSLYLSDLARPIESTVFTFVLPQTEANALDAFGTRRPRECKSVFFVHPPRNSRNSNTRNTRVLFLLCIYMYIVSNPVSSASCTDRDSCLVLHPLR